MDKKDKKAQKEALKQEEKAKQEALKQERESKCALGKHFKGIGKLGATHITVNEEHYKYSKESDTWAKATE